MSVEDGDRASEILRAMLAERSGANFKGVIDAQVAMRSGEVGRVGGDPNVLLIDVTGAYAQSQIEQQNPEVRGQKHRVVTWPASWPAEDLGVAR